jgi:hypothetical protein
MKLLALPFFRKTILTALVFTTFSLFNLADVVILQNGKTVAGTILQQDEDGILVQLDYGTTRYEKPYIKEIQKESVARSVESKNQRIPSWGKIISALASNVWVQDIKQIPATVIENGVLNNIPYISFRCNGAGYEVNIYGDLDNPAGFEIGAIYHLNGNATAKTNCIKFVATVLKDDADRKLISNLDSNSKDIKTHQGITFEITRPEEADAYNGWWVSVYDTNALSKARASKVELLAITQPKAGPKFQPQVQVPTQSTITTPEISNWTQKEISYSRPRASYSSSSESIGDRVYVKGYYRKNGTYVSGHTRSRPSR